MIVGQTYPAFDVGDRSGIRFLETFRVAADLNCCRRFAMFTEWRTDTSPVVVASHGVASCIRLACVSCNGSHFGGGERS